MTDPRNPAHRNHFPPKSPSFWQVQSSFHNCILSGLKEKGLNAYAIAGLMGNLYAESALNPRNLQNSYEKKLNMSDAT